MRTTSAIAVGCIVLNAACGGDGGSGGGFKQDTTGTGGHIAGPGSGAGQQGGAGPGAGAGGPGAGAGGPGVGAGPGSGGAGPGAGAGPGSGGSGTSTSTSTAAGGGTACGVFPQPGSPPQGQEWWNTDVSGYPTHANSMAYINYINANGGDGPLHADFDSVGDGIPFTFVDSSVAKVAVVFNYASESDAGPYPIPNGVTIENGGDRHALLVDTGSCTLYELYGLHMQGGAWQAGSGAIFDLGSNAVRHLCWTSADAAGLAIYPGLVRYAEVTAGAINHALRFTLDNSRHAWISPARHEAGCNGCGAAPPMGMRFRLKSNAHVNGILSGSAAQPKVVLTALQKYGMLLADNGSNWYVSGEPNDSWNDGDFHDSWDQITGDDFEVVDIGLAIETTCN